MKKILVLLAVTGSMLSGCATQQSQLAHPYGVTSRGHPPAYCPPSQAVRGVC